MQNNSVLPQVSIDRVSLFSDNGKTKAELLLVVKMTEKQLETENLKIKILQCKKQNMFSFLTLSKELCLEAFYPDAVPVTLSDFILNLARNKQIISTNISNRTEGATQLKSAFNNSEYLNQREIATDTESELYEMVEGDMYRRYFSVTFDIDSTRIEHLSYFIFTDFDRDSTTSIDIGNILSKTKINSDCVIDNGKVISQTYAFFLPNGDIWTGPYTYNETTKSWRTGGRNSITSNPLQRRTFFNKKTQDFRIFEQIATSPMYVQQIDEFESLKNKNPFYSKIKKQNSIIFDSILPNDNSLQFKINLTKLLEDHSPFYNFYSGDINFGTDWLKVQVYRKRIVSRNKYFKQDFMNSPLPWQGENTPIYVGIPSSERTQHLVTYRIVDRALRNVQIGQYYYYIVAQFTDPYYAQIKADLNSLKIEKQKLETYYQLSTIKENFNSEISKFTEKFREIENANSYITGPVTTYVEKFNVFNRNNIDSNLQNTITAMISPETGSPSGIMKFIELYNRLINMVTRFIKSASGNTLYTLEKEFKKNEQIIYKQKQSAESGLDSSDPDYNSELLKTYYNVSVSYPSIEAKGKFSAYMASLASGFNFSENMMIGEPGAVEQETNNPYDATMQTMTARERAQREAEQPKTAIELFQQALATRGGNTTTSAESSLKPASRPSQNNTPGSYLGAQRNSPPAEDTSNANTPEDTKRELEDRARQLLVNRG